MKHKTTPQSTQSVNTGFLLGSLLYYDTYYENETTEEIKGKKK